jgi:Bardet-Biedl syndrome 4 protein
MSNNNYSICLIVASHIYTSEIKTNEKTSPRSNKIEQKNKTDHKMAAAVKLDTIVVAASIRREQVNWLMHDLYIRQEFDDCMKVIDKQLSDCPQSEYALYLKGLSVCRHSRSTQF